MSGSDLNTQDPRPWRPAGRCMPVCRGGRQEAGAVSKRGGLSNRAISRRAMLRRTAQATAALAVGASLQPLLADDASAEGTKELVWDAHGHLAGLNGSPEERIAQLLKVADRMGVDRLNVCMGLSFSTDPSPEQFRRENDEVLRAISHSHGRAFGLVYLNPKHEAESLKELDRCVRDGPMVGVKLWVAVRCNHKSLDPIVHRAEELKAPVFQHTWYKLTGNLPGESTPDDLAELAGRHPDASLIALHVGGDWEPGIRAIRAAKNVWAEISGSDPTAGMVEMAARELGAERVIYGSDFPGRSFASQLAKVYGADVPEDARRLILGENMRRLFEPIFALKGIRL